MGQRLRSHGRMVSGGQWRRGVRPRMQGEMRCAAILALAGCATASGVAMPDVVFTRYTQLASNAEIARRALPPLTYRRIQEALAARHDGFADQAIELARERFDLYVPDGPAPATGWGLIVFVSPGDAPTRPWVWRGPLDARRLVFVAAQGSGNTRNILDRRLPLAVLAYENVRARLPIDAARVYVMGLSGGSRVAEIAALAYPDIFRGAVLNAGADPIDGQAGIYKPPADLFRAFQRSRLVLITGDQDEDNRKQDDVAAASLHRACVLGVRSEVALGLGHEALNATSLAKALDALEEPAVIDPAEQARCDAGVAHALARELADAEAAIARGDHAGARARLTAIDAHYGGLAAARLLELDRRLPAPPLAPPRR
jgi:pimeloyl-ACP methyl ester carboxylesterase